MIGSLLKRRPRKLRVAVDVGHTLRVHLAARYPAGDDGWSEPISWSFMANNRREALKRVAKNLKEWGVPKNPPWWKFWEPRYWRVRMQKAEQ